MDTDTDAPGGAKRLRPFPTSTVVSALAAVGIALIIVDHWAHFLGVLPYVVLLACPLMHLFMHKRHGHGEHRGGEKPPGA